ncbi:MAG: hypothetical protein AB8B91_17755 [Rubripirellula sp.]
MDRRSVDDWEHGFWSLGMEAGSYHSGAVPTLPRITLALLAFLVCLGTQAASYRTQNFIIQAPNAQLASSVGQAAERYRHDLAVHWLGAALPAWPNPCPVRVIAGPNLAAQGVTTYNPRPVRDFQMEVVGTPERILDSVLPHEVTHTILATHFGRPLPRWADEGICTTVEHVSERSKHEAKLREFLGTRRGIAMNQLFLLTEYPSDVLPMYAQGYSVCSFLIEQKGPRQFVKFLRDYMQHPSWTANIKKHYDYDSLADLQNYWLSWVQSGSGSVGLFVKNGNPSASSVAQASATSPAVASIASSPRGPMRLSAPQQSQLRFNDLGPSQANPSASDGWYQRKRQDALQQTTRPTAGPATLALAPRPGLNAANAPAITPIVPPSVRNSGRYRSAQPQPEQRISRDGSGFYGGMQR